MKTSSPLNQTEVVLKGQFFNPPVYTIDQAASISNGVRISLEKVGITSIGEIQIANGSKRRDIILKYSGRTAKLTAWNGVADSVGGCHLQAGKMYHIKSVVQNDFQDCRCYNASPSTTFELLEDRVEETGIIDGVVESVSFESNIIEVEDEYYNIPKNMLMAVFPSGQFVQNTNIRAKRRREEVIEIINDTFIPEEDCILSSGVKRSSTDDHSYINYKGHNASDSNDHEYSCNLHTEEDEEDDEGVNILCQDRTKQILKLLNLKSNAAYDYPSMLRTCSQTDLSEKDIFMSIIEEMKTRRLNRMSLSLSCSGKLRILDKAVLASHNMLVEAIRTNPLMKITGDNLDMYIRTNHQRTDNSNQDIHWFASNAFFTRLNYQNLPENTPEVRLKDIDAEMFVLTGGETMKLNDVKKVLIGRLLCDRDDFQWLKNKLPQHIPHRYSDSMSKKQHVYTLKIMFKNESKNEDCLDIMGEYEDQIIDLHTKAYGNTDNLDKYGVVLGGDMLTRERLQNAKNITYLAPTPRGRFEHLAPVTCELWHVKQDLLSKAYKALFKSDSFGECGTLFHMKTALRRNDVNGNVKSNYKAHEELFLLIVKALIHVASDEIRDCREQNRDIVLKDEWLQIIKLFVDANEYKQLFLGLGYSTDDYIYNYFTNLITWGMQIMNMNDTAKEGDMERLIMNMKENAAFFTATQ
ncbi:unnamed protein product [Mytilus edulis]|uniref:DUF6589 domain-containing protein n=1 Tax=Mytilus edulis TaxID=6550 RepID=A0A8S3QGZ2_MYTED|nr:unnamed protein product [Mytilus edulis]